MRKIPGYFRIFLVFFMWIVASLFGDFRQFFDLFSPNWRKSDCQVLGCSRRLFFCKDISVILPLYSRTYWLKYNSDAQQQTPAKCFTDFSFYIFSQFYIHKVSLLTETPYQLQASITPPKPFHNFSVILQCSTAKTDGNHCEQASLTPSHISENCWNKSNQKAEAAIIWSFGFLIL